MEKLILKKTATTLKPGDYPDKIVGQLIDFECEAYSEEGELLLSYFKAPAQIYQLAKVISKNTTPKKSSRTRHGVPQLSTVYGALPRNPIREDYCRFSRQTKEELQNMNKAMELNRLLAAFYEKKLPEHYKKALANVTAEVHQDYRLVETPWTNINVNMNQVIKYHRDAGNNREDLSNVLIVKEGVEGGHLACPEYNVTLHQGDGFMVFFKGQEILHGVTPCRFNGPNAFRSSIVNYTLRQLKHCYPYEQELGRLQKVKTTQALNRKETNQKLKTYLERQKAKKG
jgi:hypothetical protein